MRLDRCICELLNCTRKEGKELLKAGVVFVNDSKQNDPSKQVDEHNDHFLINGKKLEYQKTKLFMMNKPAGVVSATEDRKEKTVFDLLRPEDKAVKGLSLIGRLDKDTEGLLLLTNDGELLHRLISPKSHAEKLYYAKLKREITTTDMDEFQKGLKVDEELTALPAELSLLSKDELAFFLPEGGYAAQVVLTEGKFHQVKRMFAATGNEVLYLKRISMGGLSLDRSLKPGEYRQLTNEEKEILC